MTAANKTYTGNAQSIAQVNYITPALVLINNVFNVTINSKTISYTAAVGTVADVTAGLQALLAASTIPEFFEITWTSDATKVIGTSKVPGVPFTNTSTASGGTATLTTAIHTANSGPHDASVAKNWSGNTLPADTDFLYFDNLAIDILYGIDFLDKGILTNGVELCEVTASFSGKFGLPKYNPLGYLEYRPTYFQIPALDNSAYFRYAGTGSRAKFSFAGNNYINMVVNNTGVSEDTLAPLIVKDTEDGSFLDVYKGVVAVGIEPGDSPGIDTVVVGYLTDPVNDATVTLGSAVTNLQAFGGTTTAPTATSLHMSGSASVYITAASIDIANYSTGVLYYTGFGIDINSYIGGINSTVNFDQLKAPRNINSCVLYSGATIDDHNDTVTFVSGYALAGCTPDDVHVHIGPNHSFTVS